MSVTVNGRAIRRVWRANEYIEAWVQLTTKTGTEDDFVAVILDINAAQGIEGISARLTSRSPRGFVTMIDSILDDDHLDAWAHDFAARLADQGFTGTLTGVHSAQPPRPAYTGPPVHTGYIAWTYDLDLRMTAALDTDRNPEAGWHVAPDRTRRAAEHIATWLRPGGPQIVIKRDTFKYKISDPTVIADNLTDAALDKHRTGAYRTGAYCADDRAGTCRKAMLGSGGTTLFQDLGPTDTWQRHIEDLRDAITARPADTDLAFIRLTLRTSPSWMDIGLAQPLPPGTTEAHIRYHRHLLVDHLPDIHGIQVLTDAHLAHAPDLTGWDLTDLGHGRHLLQAPDLTPWYSHPHPDPTTLTRARRQLAPLLITPQLCADNPPPGSRTTDPDRTDAAP